jgi:hypothetical protein
MEAIMVIARDVFQVKVGQMDNVLALLEKARAEGQGTGDVSRVLTDISGNHFTLVFETSGESVDAIRERMMASFSNPELAEIMGSMMQYIESGHRTFYTVEYEG